MWSSKYFTKKYWTGLFWPVPDGGGEPPEPNIYGCIDLVLTQPEELVLSSTTREQLTVQSGVSSEVLLLVATARDNLVLAMTQREQLVLSAEVCN